jgi:glycosyltransferase involved in cell wall biosynthesis
MVTIDVAIPNYNYGRYLRQCVDSVYAGKPDGMRVIVIDNASTDNSREVLAELVDTYPDLIIRLQPENIGMHGSFNAAIDWAEADFFTILHADDLLAPGALSRATEFLAAHENVVMCFGNSLKIGHADPPMEPASGYILQSGEEFISERCRTAQNVVSVAGVVVRTAAQKKVGHFDTRIKLTTDFEMWLRFAAIGDIARLNAVQGLVRVHENNDSAFSRDRLAPELAQLMEAFCIFFEKRQQAGYPVAQARDLVERAISERAYWASIAHALRGSFRASLELFVMSVRSRPAHLILPPVGYVLARQDGFKRIMDVLREAFQRRWHA